MSLVCAAPATVRAESAPDPAALEQRVRALEDVVRQLQQEIATLRAEAASPTPSPQAATAPPQASPSPEAPGPGAAGLPEYGGATSKVFNPDIGIIGNFIAAGGHSRGGSDAFAPQPFVSLQESEASFQAVVDPYARADFFLAIGEEGIEVEEGFVTFPTFPGGLLVRAGKMRATFGRLNAFHNHTLPWVDRPLVMYNLLGGETDDPDTGIKDAGLSVSRLVPVGGLVVEATGEVLRGDSGTLFESRRRRDFALVGHLRTYGDVSESANVEVGGSYTRGRNDQGSAFVTEIYGADATFRWRPLRRAIYRGFAGRVELMWSRREEPEDVRRAFGGFVSGEYRLGRRWWLGGRYDWSRRAREMEVTDRGLSAVVSFWPSEFNPIRAQYRRTRFGDGRTANELLFQTLFTIGAHGAHAF